MSPIFIRRFILPLSLLSAQFHVPVVGQASATAGATSASTYMVVTSVVSGAARGFSDNEAQALVRRGVAQGVQQLHGYRPSAPLRLQWTIRDAGHPARPWVDVYAPAHDGQPARYAADSVAASAAPADAFVQAVANLTVRALEAEPRT